MTLSVSVLVKSDDFSMNGVKPGVPLCDLNFLTGRWTLRLDCDTKIAHGGITYGWVFATTKIRRPSIVLHCESTWQTQTKFALHFTSIICTRNLAGISCYGAPFD